MNNNSIKLFAFSIAALATIHIDTHAAAPASASRSSSSSSHSIVLPVLTAAQKEKLYAFKEKYRSGNPTTESIFNLVIQDNIHPDNIRYRYDPDNIRYRYDEDCALGWAIESHNLLLARYLLEHGANPNSLHTFFHKHVLLYARSVETVQLLLDYKADIKAYATDLLQNDFRFPASPRDLKLIALYIKHGADPDLTDGITKSPPMWSLIFKASLGSEARECAQYLIEGGVSLSYKAKDGGWKDYTLPLILKKRLLDKQEIIRLLDKQEIVIIRNRNDQSPQKNCTDTQAFIVHVKQLADNRRKNIHDLVAEHLPVASEKTFPLADLVTDYYEPEFDQMYNEPFPRAQAASSSSSSSQGGPIIFG